MEKRVLVAFLVSAGILLLWYMMFPPEPPQVQQRPGPEVESAQQSRPERPGDDGGAPAASGVEEGADRAAAEDSEAATEEARGEVRSASSEEEIVLSTDQLRVVVSNRGAVITSAVLLSYEDEQGNPLELVRSVDHEATAFPLSLPGDEDGRRLYEVVRDANGRGAELVWADGSGHAIRKRVALGSDEYSLDVSVEQAGAGPARVTVGTGLRNIGIEERKNRFARWGDAVAFDGAELIKLKHQKVKAAEVFDGRSLRFVGLEGTYFLSVLEPQTELDEVRVEPLTVMVEVKEGKREEETVLRVDVESETEALTGTLFMAPKELSLLEQHGSGTKRTLDFGFFHVISVFFLKALQWIEAWAGNWGVAIIVLTFGLRLVLFPLMHTSMVSMRKMQKVQPKVKGIQEKYKKNKKDPQVRAKMNQEMMELYRAEGVNPMGGCLPLLVQLPILWALYRMFALAIELRHAPFVWWIQDLSAKDPLFVTPVLMTATMWLQQKMAPQVGDPQQQRIMRMMPLIFGVMFLQFPSGLVLYWLTNNVLTIVQQEVTLRLLGERKSKKSGTAKERGKDKGQVKTRKGSSQ